MCVFECLCGICVHMRVCFSILHVCMSVYACAFCVRVRLCIFVCLCDSCFVCSFTCLSSHVWARWCRTTYLFELFFIYFASKILNFLSEKVNSMIDEIAHTWPRYEDVSAQPLLPLIRLRVDHHHGGFQTVCVCILRSHTATRIHTSTHSHGHTYRTKLLTSCT